MTTTTVAGRMGERLLLRAWQRDLLADLFARDPDTGRRLYRRALIGLPRKNGKSALGACIALYALFLGIPGGEIYSVAASREQARIVFRMATTMIAACPDLAAEVNVYRNAVEHKTNGCVYRVLSSDAAVAEGLNPSLVIFDEVHAQPNSDLWDTMNLGSGARSEPLVIGITTAGVRTDSRGDNSLAFGLYLHAKAVTAGEAHDPTFFAAWWEPENPDADHRDPEVWREANPGFGDLNAPDDFEAVVQTTHEAEFRTKRCNQWVASSLTWLPHGAWDGRTDASRVVPDKTPVVLGFDGSFSGDSTGLVGCTLDGHLFVVDAWERPADADETWRVPVGQVRDAIRLACQRFDVLEVAADPHLWIETLEGLAGEGLPVVEFTQSPARMVAATQRLYEAVANGTVTHDGDSRLRRHVDNCAVKTDRFGPRITKDSKGSSRKIDLAVCAAMAFDRAAQVTPAPAYSWSAY
jgi:phage terminase large subunit-like protein